VHASATPIFCVASAGSYIWAFFVRMWRETGSLESEQRKPKTQIVLNVEGAIFCEKFNLFKLISLVFHQGIRGGIKGNMVSFFKKAFSKSRIKCSDLVVAVIMSY